MDLGESLSPKFSLILRRTPSFILFSHVEQQQQQNNNKKSTCAREYPKRHYFPFPDEHFHFGRIHCLIFIHVCFSPSVLQILLLLE